VREIGAQLKELLQVRVRGRRVLDLSLVQHVEEVFRLHDLKSLLLRLALDILLINDILEEFNSGHVVVQDVQHQHHHDLERLVV